ncbi:hypothetical protein BpHYR1_043648 [Brachionus plicatilis]|uniref:Uncharacterized protein n=1 Tax=Brachionus plicatilis TaxID=10195 RepID=A0A3M7SUQ4_BRAPC|nr:hypothetical protein BpHYR1_043648 [Brachionus plicatilis]
MHNNIRSLCSTVKKQSVEITELQKSYRPLNFSNSNSIRKSISPKRSKLRRQKRSERRGKNREQHHHFGFWCRQLRPPGYCQG